MQILLIIYTPSKAAKVDLNLSNIDAEDLIITFKALKERKVG